MIERVEIISLNDREAWTEAHLEVGLPSQSWHYAWGLSATGVEPKLAVVTTDKAQMLLPFFERPWRDQIDIATILGLSGASLHPLNTAPLGLWYEYAKAQGWVAGYIQLDTISGEPPPGGADPIGQWVSHNAVFIADLRKEDYLGEASRTIRRKIAEGERSGAHLCTDQDSLAARLQVLYPLAMERFGNPALYCFPRQTLERWSFAPTSLLVGVEKEGQIEAVYLFFLAGRHAEAFISASTDNGRRLGPWVIWRSFDLLKARGVVTVNLGGGARINDNIYRFKSWWGWKAIPLVALHQIYDPVTYGALCKDVGAIGADNYFPAYRRRRE